MIVADMKKIIQHVNINRIIVIFYIIFILFTLTLAYPVEVYAQDQDADTAACGIGSKGLIGIDWGVLNQRPNLNCIPLYILHIANQLLGFVIVPIVLTIFYGVFILASNGWFGEVAGIMQQGGKGDAAAKGKSIIKGGFTVLAFTVLSSLIIRAVLGLAGANSTFFGIV
jgi:hypothetical protein